MRNASIKGSVARRLAGDGSSGFDLGGTTASSACNGANPCDVTSGAGLNYTFTNANAGAKLRLAQQ